MCFISPVLLRLAKYDDINIDTHAITQHGS